MGPVPVWAVWTSGTEVLKGFYVFLRLGTNYFEVRNPLQCLL